MNRGALADTKMGANAMEAVAIDKIAQETMRQRGAIFRRAEERIAPEAHKYDPAVFGSVLVDDSSGR